MDKRTFKIYGRRLQAARVKAGHTQDTLAQAIGMGKSSIAGWEGRAIASPFLTIRNELIAALGMTVEQFEKTVQVAGAAGVMPLNLRESAAVGMSPESIELIESAPTPAALADAFEKVARELRKK